MKPLGDIFEDRCLPLGKHRGHKEGKWEKLPHQRVAARLLGLAPGSQAWLLSQDPTTKNETSSFLSLPKVWQKQSTKPWDPRRRSAPGQLWDHHCWVGHPSMECALESLPWGLLKEMLMTLTHPALAQQQERSPQLTRLIHQASSSSRLFEQPL